MAIGGLRIIARLIISGDVHILSKKINSKQKQVLVYGAGDAGVQLVSGLEYSSEYSPVGFIDDATDLQSNQIRGLNIYSADDISTLINRFNLDEILIAIPSLSRSDRNTMLEKLEPYPVEVRLLPGVSELADGKVNIDDLREVDIKDLLGRNIVEPNKDLLGKNITNRVVVVTGAGGSIGSELCRQIVLFKPKALILYEMSELALYNIEKELSSIGINAIDIYPMLGSVNNKSRLSNIFKRFDVDTVYHAAAYKHVPMVEFNTTEGVNNNVFGTLNCAQAAIDEGVETFVLISTDKAVRPTNTMGATKRSAELILQALSAEQNSTKFTMVRFGNVLESSGSVIPLFKQQIKSGGPVTVTDKDIIRYFMTIPEAVELVIQAGAMGTGGDVFVLDMGKPVRIDDLAKKMIRLSGLEVKDESNPDGDIEINYIGLRPGEKLFEELLIGDNVDDTNHALILRAEEEMLTWEELEPIFDELSKAVKDCDQELSRSLLKKIVPGFQPQCDIEDILYQK
jgi:FlaA1/EpsC-like NDP-sugar epimerase